MTTIETRAKGLPSLTVSQDTKKVFIKLSVAALFKYRTVTTTCLQVDQRLQKSSYLLHHLEGTSFDIFLCSFSSSAHVRTSKHPSSSLSRLSLSVKEGAVVSAATPNGQRTRVSLAGRTSHCTGRQVTLEMAMAWECTAQSVFGTGTYEFLSAKLHRGHLLLRPSSFRPSAEWPPLCSFAQEGREDKF